MGFFRVKFLGVFLIALLFGCSTPPVKPSEPVIAGQPETLTVDTIDDYDLLEPVAKIDDDMPDLPVYKLQKSKRVVAVQVLLFNCQNMDEVEDKIKRLKAAGVNTLILRVFHNRGDRRYSFAKNGTDAGVYFKTDHAPVVDDILAEIADISHRNGMDIYAWMTTRYADYGVEERVGWHEIAYDLESGKYKRAKGLNLFNREVKNHLINIYRDLAKYDIDGILFQDDLVLRHTEGFNADARKEYARYCGRMPDPEKFYREIFKGEDGKYRVSKYGEEFYDWCRWKNQKILGAAGEIMAAVKTERPDVKFAINLMYEAALSPKDALAWLSQDLEAAVRSDFDLIAVMAYHRQMSKELGIKGKELGNAVARLVEGVLDKVKDPDRALIKLQIADWKSGRTVSLSEIESILKIVRRRGGSSLAFVPYREEFDFEGISHFLKPL